MTTRAPNYVGRKYARLTVLSQETRLNAQGFWQTWCTCQCRCGNTHICTAHGLQSGSTRSCGCLMRETSAALGKKHRTHQMSKTRLYYIWHHMKRRSTGEESVEHYASRGITCCAEWLVPENFFTWARANGYNKNKELDRVDNNGNYCPENCRWTDHHTQTRNKRNNRNITFDGKTQCLVDWAKDIGRSHATILWRINQGWPLVRALSSRDHRL